MVRPTLEYASAAWDSYISDQINQLARSNAEQHVLSATITETKPQDASLLW
jgi:hypothetical protein